MNVKKYSLSSVLLQFFKRRKKKKYCGKMNFFLKLLLRCLLFHAIITAENRRTPMQTWMKKNRAERGQVLTEYAVLIVMFVLVAAVMLLLLAVFLEYGWRITALIGWEPWV